MKTMANQLFLRLTGDSIEDPAECILCNAETSVVVGAIGTVDESNNSSGKADDKGKVGTVNAVDESSSSGSKAGGKKKVSLVNVVGESSDAVGSRIKKSEVNSREKGKTTSKLKEENWLRRKIQEEIDRRLLENRIAHLEEKVRQLSGILLY
jgi:hypothetical protein